MKSANCGEYTLDKERLYSRVLEDRFTTRKYKDIRFSIVDTNAGTPVARPRFSVGYRVYEGNAIDGSSIYGVNTARRNGVPYTAILIDKDPTVVEQLQRIFVSRNEHVYCDDMVHAHERVLENDGAECGLAFVDPPHSIVSYSLANQTIDAVRKHTNLDILVHLSPSAAKRQRNEQALDEIRSLFSIDGMHTYIKPPVKPDKHQWFFVMLTRKVWDNAAAFSFEDVHSKHAQSVTIPTISTIKNCPVPATRNDSIKIIFVGNSIVIKNCRRVKL